MNFTVVSYYFPPSRIANSRRPWLLAREMSRRGHRVNVITHAPPLSEADEDYFAQAREVGLRVELVDDPLLRWQRRWGKVGALRCLMSRLWPDNVMPWTICAARLLRRQVEGTTVLACVHPVSSLLLHRLVHARQSDLVYDYLESVTPFRRHVPYDCFPHRHLAGSIERIERSALLRARGAIFTSQRCREAYIDAGFIDPRRSAYIPHACDPIPLAGRRVATDGVLVVSHVGHFNQDRSPETFLRGLALFIQRTGAVRRRFRVDLYGNGLGPYPQLPTELGIDGLVKDCGEVGRGEWQAAVAQSHALLLVAGPRHNLFFPSKIPEYVAARRPILAILPPDSEANAFLQRTGRGEWTCEYGDVEAVARCLREIWNRFLSGRLGDPLPENPSVLMASQVDRWEAVLEGSLRFGGP